MADKGGSDRESRARRAADRTVREEETLRERWDATQSSLLERFDEPIARATELTRRTLAWSPVRVWRHFLQHNGFLLAASISYQSLFAIFAVLYVAFAAVGLWLGGSTEAIEGLIKLVNSYIPGLISDDGGLLSPASVTQVAHASNGALAVTGAIAVVVAMWTAIGFVTFARRAVRRIPLQVPSESERLRAEHEALLTAARVRLRTAQAASAEASWFGRWSANRAVREAEAELERVEASAPVPDARRGVLG